MALHYNVNSTNRNIFIVTKAPKRPCRNFTSKLCKVFYKPKNLQGNILTLKFSIFERSFLPLFRYGDTANVHASTITTHTHQANILFSIFGRTMVYFGQLFKKTMLTKPKPCDFYFILKKEQ